MCLLFLELKNLGGGLYCTVCRILVPQQGIEPTSLAVEVWNLSQQTTRGALLCVSFAFTLLSHSPRRLHFWPSGPHTKAILCHTVWVFHNLAQFWHYLSRDSVRFHRFGAQSQETAPILLLLPGSPQLLSSLAAIRGSDPFLGFDYFTRTAHWTQGNVLLLASLLKYTIKDTDEQPGAEIQYLSCCA